MVKKKLNVLQKREKNINTRLLSVFGYIGTVGCLAAYFYISLLNNQLEARSWLGLAQVWLPIIIIIIIGVIVANIISAFKEVKWRKAISIICISLNIIVLAVLLFTYAFAASA